jgi:polygalacturonase
MDFDIRDYGALESSANNQKAIQKALDEASDKGGRVIIPEGTWMSGSIRLRSHTDLHLETGAVLTASLDPEAIIDFSRTYEDDNADTGWEGGCFLYAAHEEDITISGHGTIDGQGRKVFYDDDEGNELHECPLHVHGFRPRLSFLEDIRNLTVQDVTFKDSAFWTLHMAGCQDVLIEGIRIFNNDRGPNNDGIDPDCCHNVIIRGCLIETADDCVVVKTTKPMAEKYHDCADIMISDCRMYSHSCALKIGTETWGDIHHVTMHDCIVRNSTRAVGIWSRDGGHIHDLYIHHVSGSTRAYADRTAGKDMVVCWWGKGEPVIITSTRRAGVERIPGLVDHVCLDHLFFDCEGAITLAGEKESPLRDIHLKDSRFHFILQGSQIPHMLDEQPSVRGKYEHEVPCVYERGCENVEVQAEFDIDETMKPYICKQFIIE